MKGTTIPMGDGVLNMTLREPYGVVARIVAYNRPLMFTAGKLSTDPVSSSELALKHGAADKARCGTRYIAAERNRDGVEPVT
jgi:acyl-CoA reductase-like NAD-dependent aldehyde dehydrogenase